MHVIYVMDKIRPILKRVYMGELLVLVQDSWRGDQAGGLASAAGVVDDGLDPTIFFCHDSAVHGVWSTDAALNFQVSGATV